MTSEEKFELESAEAAAEVFAQGPTLVKDDDPDELRITRAWVRAHDALQLAYQPGLPLPSARIFPDGSAEFIFPGRLAQAWKGKAGELTKLIGSNRLSIASTVAEDPDAVSIRVAGEVLGREQT